MSRTERYEQLVQESALVWHKLYEEEREARQELQRKYDLLTQKIKEQGIKKATENPSENIERDYWDNLAQSAIDDGEDWDDGRIDVIGQNGNDGLHYGWVDNKLDKYKEQENASKKESSAGRTNSD